MDQLIAMCNNPSKVIDDYFSNLFKTVTNNDTIELLQNIKIRLSSQLDLSSYVNLISEVGDCRGLFDSVMSSILRNHSFWFNNGKLIIINDAYIPFERISYSHRLTHTDITKSIISQLDNINSDVIEISLRNQTSIKINSSTITDIESYAFDNFGYITHLNLGFNRIETLYKNIFENLVNLEELRLHSNCISSIDKTVFSHMSKLRILNLGCNNITSLHPKIFRNLRQLVKLSLIANDLKHLSSGIFADILGCEIRLEGNPQLFKFRDNHPLWEDKNCIVTFYPFGRQ